MKFGLLYHENKKGDIYTWKVWNEKDTVYTEYGKENGKKQVASYKAKGKNVGKANATTDEEQAEQEARSLWNAKLTKKYFKSKNEAKGALLLRPMLAEKYQDYPELVESWGSVFLQPKLDGVRCLAYLNEEGKVTLLSRGGKFYDIPHIAKELEGYFKENPKVVLDGEIYIHGESLQQIGSLVKIERKQFNSDEAYEDHKRPLIYHVFDMIDLDLDCILRFSERLEQWETKLKGLKYINPVPTLVLINKEQLHSYMDKFVSYGYEGMIIRNGDGQYVLGGRSKDLLKLKNFQDDEFEVVGYKHGKGKYSDSVIWLVKTKDGVEVDVVPVGTMAEKKQMLENADKFIGKMLTVKFINYTPDGSLFHPVGVKFREEGE